MMSEYHELLEESLNSVYIPKKLPEELIPRPKQVWMSKPKSGFEVAQLQKKNLAKTVMPSGPSDAPFGLGLNSYKVLSEISVTRKLSIPIPETLVYGYGFESPTLLYTDTKQVLQIIPKLSMQSFEIFLKILISQRNLSPNIISPLGLSKSPNSIFNKIYMRENDLKQDLKNIHKTDSVIQRYILPKGSMSSKYRVVMRREDTKAFKVINKSRFDRSANDIIQVNESKQDNESSFLRPSTTTQHEKKSYLGSNLKTEIVKSLTKKEILLNKKSTSTFKENKYDTIEDFMASIPQEQEKYDLAQLYTQIYKPQSKTQDYFDDLPEDFINGKITNKLRSMFCTYTKNIEASNIIELKSQKILDNLTALFNYIKETLDLALLIKNNYKISELTCDFAEDTDKKLYFLQIKHAKCKKINYMPLKSIKMFKKFTCPGEHCDDKVPSYHNELFAQSVLYPTKKVIPSKCKVLLGTILGEKTGQNDNIKKLNPRLFEGVRVCENCFLYYNEKNDKRLIECRSLGKFKDFDISGEGDKDKDEDFVPVEERYKKRKLKCEDNYMSMLGIRLHKFQKEILSRALVSQPKIVLKKERSVFACKKKSIDNATHYSDFVKKKNANN